MAATLFGEKLRELRKERRWSLDDLAARIGSSKSHLSSIETGRTRDPSVSVMQKLAATFEVSLDFLFDTEATTPDGPDDRAFITRYRQLDPTVRAKVRATARLFKGASS